MNKVDAPYIIAAILVLVCDLSEETRMMQFDPNPSRLRLDLWLVGNSDWAITRKMSKSVYLACADPPYLLLLINKAGELDSLD